MTRVIKVGGRPQGDPKLIAAIAAANRTSPQSLVVVHGGGDEVSSLQTMYGVPAEFKNGRRITSALDLEIIRMALSGSANKRLVSKLVSVGVQALGISGEDASLLVAEPYDPRTFGFVGVPEHVNVKLLTYLMAGGYCPVISPVSRSSDADAGTTLNVNGDDAAASIAVAMKAEELLLVSDVEGVRSSGKPDPSMALRMTNVGSADVSHSLGTTLSALTIDEAQKLIDKGIAQGGMNAKLSAAIRALQGGVERVRISDIAAITSLDRGTVLTRARSMSV